MARDGIDITTESVYCAISHVWISRFRCPATITTEHGRQFESDLFKELTRFLGTNHMRAILLHPHVNGLV